MTSSAAPCVVLTSSVIFYSTDTWQHGFHLPISQYSPVIKSLICLYFLQPENAEGQKSKVMYCKEKIYAGTQEFSFEELRAARIFARVREGTFRAPAIERPPTNVRYMYPKKEIYDLIRGEFQYEEILARRYYARQKNEEATRNSQKISSTIQCKTLPASGKQGGFEMHCNKESCAMEIGSCQKSVVSTVPEPNTSNEVSTKTVYSRYRYI